MTPADAPEWCSTCGGTRNSRRRLGPRGPKHKHERKWCPDAFHDAPVVVPPAADARPRVTATWAVECAVVALRARSLQFESEAIMLCDAGRGAGAEVLTNRAEEHRQAADFLAAALRAVPAGTPDAWLVEWKDGRREPLVFGGATDPRTVHNNTNCNYVPLYRAATRRPVEDAPAMFSREEAADVEDAADFPVTQDLAYRLRTIADKMRRLTAAAPAPSEGE